MSLRRLSSVFLCALACLCSARAQAAKQKQKLSDYERDTTRSVLSERHLEEEPAPDGKVIESVEIVRLPVLEERDIAPLFLTTDSAPGRDPELRSALLDFINRPHVLSREEIIDREVLFKVGEAYRLDLADETERNLRRLLRRLSLVLCVKAKGSKPDTVRILVVTKDVWSLRFAWDVKASSGGIESLSLAPSETNVAGMHHSLTAAYTMSPATHTMQLSYEIPRFGRSYWGASAQVATIVNRESGEREGGYGSLVVSRPLYTTRTEWGLNIGGSFRSDIVRRFVNAKLATYDAKITAYDDRVPFAYTREATAFALDISRSYGVRYKLDLSFGAGVSRSHYSTPGLDAYEPEVVAEFQKRNVPTSDRRTYPYAQIRAYTTRFLHPVDVETLALQEDVRLGHDLYARVYPVLEVLGSSRSLAGTYLAGQYTMPLSDGYTRVGVESTTEFQGSDLVTGVLRGNARLVTPKLGIGRLVYDGSFVRRYKNYQNAYEYLGGLTRLRGYPTNFFQGQDIVSWNFEYRSKAIPVLSAQFAPAVFFDVGSASSDMLSARLFHSAGAGFRLLIPQLDRVVMRFDIGFPIDRPRGVEPMSFFFSVDQAFPLSSVGP